LNANAREVYIYTGIIFRNRSCEFPVSKSFAKVVCGVTLRVDEGFGEDSAAVRSADCLLFSHGREL
jgi:hypothetical protein